MRGEINGWIKGSKEEGEVERGNMMESDEMRGKAR